MADVPSDREVPEREATARTRPWQWIVGGFLTFVAIALVVGTFVGVTGGEIWLNIVIIAFLVVVLPVVAVGHFASSIRRRFR